MEQYLLELIKNNNRVIVPNFGAFIVSRDAGTTVLFNNFLSFNDGLLINHVSSQEAIDTTQATRKVSEFVEKVKQDLNENGEYTIEKLGRFTKDQNGILRFTQDPKVSELIPDKPDKEAKNEKEPEKKEDSALLDLDSEDQPESQSNTGKKTEEKPKEETKSKQTTAASASKDQPTASKAQAQKSPQKPAGKTAQPSEKSKAGAKKGATGKKPPVSPPPFKDKNRKSGLPPWAIALLILIPVILIALYFLLWRGDTEQQKTVEEQPQVTDTIKEKPQIDSAAIKQAKKEEEERLKKEEQQAKEEQQKTQQGPRHHIIVGSFSKESNARELVKKLKSEGFDSAMYFKRNNLTLVSADSFKSLSDAYDAQQRVLQEQRMENWILTRR